MSRSVTNLTVEIEEKIFQELLIEQEPSKYMMFSKPESIQAFSQDTINGVYHVPFAYDQTLSRPARESFSKRNIKFEAKLRDEQKKVRSEAIEYLNKTGSVIIATFTGFGKSITALNIASKIGMKTLILVHRIVLINQWKSSIEKFCPSATVQVLDSSSDMEDCDFYIMNALNVPKNSRKFYRDIGVVTVDEAHILLAEQLSKSLLHLSPRYLIGLSATPYRSDGLNVLFDLYFGPKKIERKLWRRHLVYQVESGFTPEVELAKNGKVNWNSVLNSQCDDVERNEMIIRLLKFFSKRVFLVLCKRVSQAKYLLKRLQEEKEDVTSLIGKEQTYASESRILVGTTGKTATGFDHPRLNALLLASDVEQYYLQALGRVFRTQKVEPLILDIVDNNPILKKHYRTRQSVYLEHGGVIKNFRKEFPKIKLL